MSLSLPERVATRGRTSPRKSGQGWPNNAPKGWPLVAYVEKRGQKGGQKGGHVCPPSTRRTRSSTSLGGWHPRAEDVERRSLSSSVRGGWGRQRPLGHRETFQGEVGGRESRRGGLVTLIVTVRPKSLSRMGDRQGRDRTSAPRERVGGHANGKRGRHLHGFTVATGR